MKRYECLFILNTAGKEEGVKDLIDKVSAEIVAGGGKIETVQRMEKRPFARITDKKVTAGFYVNIIFALEPVALPQLRSRFLADEDVYRVLIANAPPAKEPAAATV